MKTGNTSIVVDTYAWIEYFRGTRKGEIVKEKLLSAPEIYTPSIVLAEIARKYLRENMPEPLVEERLKIITEASIIIGIDQKIALEAGKAYIELAEASKKQGLKHKPSLNDAIILASARKLQAKVLTNDKHFKNLEETIWLG